MQPIGARHADDSLEPWRDSACHDEVDIPGTGFSDGLVPHGEASLRSDDLAAALLARQKDLLGI